MQYHPSTLQWGGGGGGGVKHRKEYFTVHGVLVPVRQFLLSMDLKSAAISSGYRGLF